MTFISEGTALQDLRFLLRTVIQTEIPPKNGDVGAQKIKYLFFFFQQNCHTFQDSSALEVYTSIFLTNNFIVEDDKSNFYTLHGQIHL